jgi:hypothetical protein
MNASEGASHPPLRHPVHAERPVKKAHGTVFVRYFEIAKRSARISRPVQVGGCESPRHRRPRSRRPGARLRLESRHV